LRSSQPQRVLFNPAISWTAKPTMGQGQSEEQGARNVSTGMLLPTVAAPFILIYTKNN